ncbi:MAG: hypothetical protein GWM98_25860, partial [Nitrospinaceae bacterium]|nr:hypothetical protein [Nitrospinaceae bacterium]NIS87722.1 hypothetical protein [Nitrospinaceae bacterium]NIT84588.1 hypothetical protein [Nitrospinaceae bacterium]NIU98969.1 hypothetical protein [Nitrospinaceae bacterium]NIY18049.1 hypothetical protein [Nitrospinaceae bacterium]
MSRLGKTEFLARLRRTAQYLQAECDAGRLLGFGVSFCESRPGGPDEGSLLFPDVWPRLQEFPGFSAVEFHANFLEAGPFRGLGGNPSPVSQVKAAGRLVLCSGPLRAWHEGQELGLVDRPDLGPEALQAQRNQLARDLEHTEQEIHATLCRDGRSLKEILRQANAPSPFQLRALAQACLESPEVTP